MDEMKQCRVCREPFTPYRPAKNHQVTCSKKCRRIWQRTAIKKDKEKHRDRVLAERKRWYARHPENPQRRSERQKRWRQANPEKARAKVYRYQKKHPELGIIHTIVKRMIRPAQYRKSERSRFYIGCSAEFLRGWLESQFQPGMAWENYGKVWVVDHVVPLAWWDLPNHPEHLIKANHYTNLQPKLRIDNLVKGARFIG